MRQQRGPPEADTGEELVDQGVGDGGLALVAAPPDHRQVPVTADELADQGGLPDPRGSPEQDGAGTAGAHLREQRVQDAELVLPPNEGLVLHRSPAGAR